VDGFAWHPQAAGVQYLNYSTRHHCAAELDADRWRPDWLSQLWRANGSVCVQGGRIRRVVVGQLAERYGVPVVVGAAPDNPAAGVRAEPPVLTRRVLPDEAASALAGVFDGVRRGRRGRAGAAG
jgi:hypothetical protein